MNTANADGIGYNFSKITQLDSRYSLFYTVDSNQVYLYDTHTGTYSLIY